MSSHLQAPANARTMCGMAYSVFARSEGCETWASEGEEPTCGTCAMVHPILQYNRKYHAHIVRMAETLFPDKYKTAVPMDDLMADLETFAGVGL